MRTRGPFDAIFSLGDAIDAYDQPDQAQIELRWRLVEAQLDGAFPGVPKYWVVGNHDLGQRSATGEFPGAGAIERRQGAPAGAALYFSKGVGSLQWIALDAETSSAGKSLGPAQLEWLEREVQAAGRPVILLSHTPILGTEGFAADAPTTLYFANGSTLRLSKQDRANFFTIGNAAAVLARLTPRVVLVLSGHLHSYNRVTRDGRTAISLTTTSPSLALSTHGPNDPQFARAYQNQPGDPLPAAIARSGFATLRVLERQLEFSAYTDEGSLLDTYSQNAPTLRCNETTRVESVSLAS